MIAPLTAVLQCVHSCVTKKCVVTVWWRLRRALVAFMQALAIMAVAVTLDTLTLGDLDNVVRIPINVHGH